MIVALPRHVFYFVYFIYQACYFLSYLDCYNIRVPSFILTELFFLFL